MKKCPLLILICYLLTSCSNDLKKSVLTPLDEGVILKHAAVDSLFTKKYTEIRELVDSGYVKQGKNDMIEGLTYQRVFDFLEASHAEANRLKSDPLLRKNWINKYERLHKKFLSDSVRFMQYISDNSYKKFVEIQFERAYRKNGSSLPESVADIKVIPKDDNLIRSITGYLIFVKKGEKYDENRGFVYVNGFFSKNGSYDQDFTIQANEPMRKYELSNFVDIPKEIIDIKYDTYFDVSELVLKDRFIDVNLDSVPDSFMRYIKDPKHYRSDTYIQNEIDSTYLSEVGYIAQQVREKLESKYRTEFKFYDDGFKFLWE